MNRIYEIFMDAEQRNEPLFDVVAVELGTKKIRWVMVDKREADAEACVKMAVVRQGVDECFFTAVPARLFVQGDLYDSDKVKAAEVRRRMGAAV